MPDPLSRPGRGRLLSTTMAHLESHGLGIALQPEGRKPSAPMRTSAEVMTTLATHARALGRSSDGMAGRLGVPARTLRRWELAESSPPLAIAIAYAVAVGVRVVIAPVGPSGKAETP